MDYSPKLQELINQIEKMMKDNGVAGSIMLCDPPYTEVLLIVDSPFSFARLVQTPAGMACHINAKSEDLIRDKEGTEAKLKSTISLIYALARQGYELTRIADPVLKILDGTFNVTSEVRRTYNERDPDSDVNLKK